MKKKKRALFNLKVKNEDYGFTINIDESIKDFQDIQDYTIKKAMIEANKFINFYYRLPAEYEEDIYENRKTPSKNNIHQFNDEDIFQFKSDQSLFGHGFELVFVKIINW
jgi:hypothetical protein